jgi:predicted ATPase
MASWVIARGKAHTGESESKLRRRGPAWTLLPPRDSFIGRAAEISEITARLGDGARIVTLTGPAGIGKTRLALETVRRLARGGRPIAFCDLSDARSRAALVTSTAEALGFAAGTMTTEALEEHVGRSLARTGSAIVVLDNFEQLVEDADVIGTWAEAAPNVAFLVTSRERLRLEGEHTIEVAPLDTRDDALVLLVERARAVSSRFAYTDAERSSAMEIVNALDGIPLAIELCAARLGVLGLAQLREQLRRGTLSVGVGARGASTRKATLRGALEWSWDLLAERERETLARCSVFRGGWGLEAVRAVLELPGNARGTTEALERMQALHDRSLLLTVRGAREGERRFALYASIREYAAAELEARGRGERARALHAAHYLAMGAKWAHAADGENARDARARLVVESGNISAVARRAMRRLAAMGSLAASVPPPEPSQDDVIEAEVPSTEDPKPASEPATMAHQALGALVSLEHVYGERGPIDPYAEALDRAIAAAREVSEDSGEDALVVRALVVRARLAVTRGRFDEALVGFEAARESAKKLGDLSSLALATSKLAVMSAFSDRKGSTVLFDEAEQIARSVGDARLEGICFSDRASALSREGAEHAALDLRERAVFSFTRAGDAHRRAISLGFLGSHCLAVGRIADAERHAMQSLEELHTLGDLRTEGQVLGFLARARHGRGRLPDARAAFAAALTRLATVGDRWFGGVYEGWMGDVALEEEKWTDAIVAYERASEQLELTGERPYAALFRAALALAHASRDGADVRFEDVPNLPIMITTAIDLHRAHASLVRRTISDAEARAARFALDAAALASSDDVRFAARLLDRSLASRSGDQVLLVGSDGRWFERTGETRVRLDRHRGIRLLLRRLVEERLAAPGRAVPRDELIHAGWPGERIQPEAAANRLNVSLSRMKKLGLRDLLRSRDDGVLLDPSVPCKCKED